MHAEIVTTGTELLLGEIVDTNAAYIARRLRTIGLNLFYKTTVGDNEERMVSVLKQALARSDVLIVTGGLGPTVDDVTRPAVARATGRELVLDEQLLASIERHFQRWGRPMSENNRRQAYKPAGAIGIENPVGTAPIFIIEQEGKIIVTLPGVPREMVYLLDNVVLPYLREKLGLTEVIITKNLHTCAIGESNIDQLVGDLELASNPTVGLAAHPGQTDVRITAKASSEEEAGRLIGEMEARVRERLGDVIFGADDETLQSVVVRLLQEKGLTVALVETNTLGRIAQGLTSVTGGLESVKGSLIASTEESLRRSFELPEEAWKDPSPHSAERTIAVAGAIRGQYDADIGLAVLGTHDIEEGPYGRRSGQTCIALATPTGNWAQNYAMGGRDEHGQIWISIRALDMLRRYLLGLPLTPGQTGRPH